MPAPAVVLLSGGLDSATCLWLAREDGFAPHALAVRYGQRHEHELTAAESLCAALGVPFRIVGIDLRAIGGSALTADIAVPKDRPVSGPDAPTGIPVTYVPARNTVLLALALGHAEVIGAQDLYVGVNAVDYSGYPDCRPEFVAAFEALANVATAAAARLAHPGDRPKTSWKTTRHVSPMTTEMAETALYLSSFCPPGERAKATRSAEVRTTP